MKDPIPFKDLSREEKIKLVVAMHVDEVPVQFLASNGAWVTKHRNPFCGTGCYRIKPVPDTINWDHIHPDFKYIRRDAIGTVLAYTHKPQIVEGSGCWCVKGGSSRYESVAALISYKRGTMEWDEMICDRPGV